MTPITREYLDALDEDPQTADMPDLLAALRRVLDLTRYNFGDLVAPSGVRYGTAYFIHAADLDAALAGTQTDDGEEDVPGSGGSEPAPSSPDHADALAAENARLRTDRAATYEREVDAVLRAEKAEAQVHAVEALCDDPRARYIDGMRWVGAVNVRNALATTEAGEES